MTQWRGHQVRITPLPANADGIRVWAFAYADVDYVMRVQAFDAAGKVLPDPPGDPFSRLVPDCSNNDDVPLYQPYCPNPYPSPASSG